MKKLVTAIIFLLITVPFIPCQEVFFRIIEDSPAWGGSFYRKDNIKTTIKKNEIVKGKDFFISRIDEKKCFVSEIENSNYNADVVQSNMLVPAYTSDLFDDSWITPPDSDSKWLIDYYLQVLLSKNRDTFYEFEYDFIDSWNKAIEENENNMYYEKQEWYEGVCESDISCLYIFQTGISTGGFLRKNRFLIKNIANINNGYKVTVIDCTLVGGNSYAPDHKNTIAFSTDRSFFDLLLIRDNDYMDMYLDTLENHLATFVYVNGTVVNMLKTLLKTNNCDLSNIKLPQRANGSMDYPPPLDMTNYKATHRVLENLRLRDAANTGSKVVTTLPKDAEVQVVEKGSAATINDITAPWVKVVSSTGYTGWCFSGYLEEIKIQPPEIPAIGVEIEKQTRAEKTDAEENSKPARLWLIVVAVVMAGGVAVFLAVKRKR